MELTKIGMECFDFSMIAIDTAMAAQDAMNQSAN
jgi:hypothetical protein